MEGLPLAVELAATWTDTLPLPTLEAEIEQSLDLLAADVEDMAPRHRSMRAAFDISWRLLDDDERLTFAQCAVFAGPFTAQAMQAVVRLRGDQAPGPGLIARLVGKSLLRFHPATVRYSVHELLRQFGAEQLAEELASAAERHTNFYAALVAAANTAFRAGRYPEAFQALEDDLAQVLRAWQWHMGHDGIGALTAMIDSLMYFVERRGRYADAFALLKGLLDRIGASGVDDGAAHQRLVARALVYQTIFDPDVAHARQVAADAEALLASLAAASVDVRSEAALLHLCTGSLLHMIDVPAAHAAMVQGEMARADRLLAEAIDRYRAADAVNPGPLVYRALTTRALGRDDEARRWMLESLQMLAKRFGALPAGEWLLAASLFLVDERDILRAAVLFAVADRDDGGRDSPLYMDLAGREVAAAIAQLPAAEQQAAIERAAELSLTTMFPDLCDEFSTRWRAGSDATAT